MQNKEIHALRNLPEIRKWMTNPNPIAWHDHLDFIESLSKTDNRRYYAIFKNGTLAGTYNLTKETDTTWERGIIASPKFQGTGSTADIEQWIISMLPKDTFTTITAKVKLDNQRSIHYHEKVGYQETHRDNEYIYFKIDTNMIQKLAMGGGKYLISNDCLTQMAMLIALACLQNQMKVCR